MQALLAWPGSAYWLRLSAAMACPSGWVGEQLERHAESTGSRCGYGREIGPPVQRFANRPFNVELLQARGSLGQLGGPPAFLKTLATLGATQFAFTRMR